MTIRHFGTLSLLATLLGAAELPNLVMPQNNLNFRQIEGYEDYKVVASHYRTDKKEIRYILANPIAYKALKEKTTPMPEGSVVVKIGWNAKPMPSYPDALEAENIQRIEYMLKDSKRFNQNGDHWGYARFVKKGDRYETWTGDTAECVACHAIVPQNDYLFTTLQPLH